MPREPCSRERPSKPATARPAPTPPSRVPDGVYRFPALPPGAYEITATLQGFKPAKLTDAVLELGRNLVIDLTLTLATLSETVSVTAESSALIDLKGNAATASITRATIERMPKGRDFATILRQAPGAQQESKAGYTGTMRVNPFYKTPNTFQGRREIRLQARTTF